MLLKALRRHPEAKFSFPNDQMIAELKSILLEKHDVLEGVHCFMDGLKLMLEQAADDDIQAVQLNDWTKDHYIINLFVFGVCGRIIACILIAPGCLHDYALATWGGVCQALQDVHGRIRVKCCVNSAFSAKNSNYMTQSAQDPQKQRML